MGEKEERVKGEGEIQNSLLLYVCIHAMTISQEEGEGRGEAKAC